MSTDQDNPFDAPKSKESCPKCDSELTIKSSKSGTFLGCTAYPECDYTRPLSPSSEVSVVKTLDDVCCPECEGDLAVKTGKYGMFIGCMNYPDCTFTVKQGDDNDFEPMPCPECGEGELHMRSNKKGHSFYACDQYPKCEYLVNQKPVYTRCSNCSWGIMVEHNGTTVCPKCNHSDE